jgi:hypothetical protein
MSLPYKDPPSHHSPLHEEIILSIDRGFTSPPQHYSPQHPPTQHPPSQYSPPQHPPSPLQHPPP